MHSSLRRALAAVAAATLTVTGLAVTALPASADDPVTSTETFASGTITADFSDTVAQAGESFTVTVTFDNTGWADENARYSFDGRDTEGDPLFLYEQCTSTSELAVSCGTGSAGDLYVYFAEPIPAGTQAQIVFAVQVAADAEPLTERLFQSGSFGSESRKSFDPPVDFTVEEVPEADLGVTLSATAGPILTSQITYDVAVANQGPGDADSSTIEVELPSRVYGVSGLPGECSYSSATDVVTCDTGAIGNGAVENLSFRANLGLLSIGSLPATATRTASSPADPNAGNDSSSVTCTVLTSLLVSCPATEL